MHNELAMYGLSAMVFLLGVVSLFVQKIYKVDEKTGEKTEIDLPFFGKLKTNYPALAFAFIGAAMATYTFHGRSVKDNWLIRGEFKGPDSYPIDWNWDDGILAIYPCDLSTKMNPNGKFDIKLQLPRGYKFEDVMQEISYSNKSGKTYIDARIPVVKEYESFKKSQESSQLKMIGATTRIYKPITVEVYQVK